MSFFLFDLASWSGGSLGPLSHPLLSSHNCDQEKFHFIEMLNISIEQQLRQRIQMHEGLPRKDKQNIPDKSADVSEYNWFGKGWK